jgi:hypothetical protein
LDVKKRLHRLGEKSDHACAACADGAVRASRVHGGEWGEESPERQNKSAVVLIFAPLASGVLSRLKEMVQAKRGPSIFQSYRDL